MAELRFGVWHPSHNAVGDEAVAEADSSAQQRQVNNPKLSRKVCVTRHPQSICAWPLIPACRPQRPTALQDSETDLRGPSVTDGQRESQE